MIEKNLENDSDKKLLEVIDITSEVIDNKVSSKSATQNLSSIENLADSEKPLNSFSNEIDPRKMRHLMTARKSTNTTKSVKKLKTANEEEEDFSESDDDESDESSDNTSEEDIVEESKPEVVTETVISYGKGNNVCNFLVKNKY
jgi:hypothetical protein